MKKGPVMMAFFLSFAILPTYATQEIMDDASRVQEVQGNMEVLQRELDGVRQSLEKVRQDAKTSHEAMEHAARVYNNLGIIARNRRGASWAKDAAEEAWFFDQRTIQALKEREKVLEARLKEHKEMLGESKKSN